MLLALGNALLLTHPSAFTSNCPCSSSTVHPRQQHPPTATFQHSFSLWKRWESPLGAHGSEGRGWGNGFRNVFCCFGGKQNACSQPGPREGGDARSGAEPEGVGAGTNRVFPQFRKRDSGMVPEIPGKEAPTGNPGVHCWEWSFRTTFEADSHIPSCEEPRFPVLPLE